MWKGPISKQDSITGVFQGIFQKFRTAYLQNTSKQLPPLFKVVCDVAFYLSAIKYTDTFMH